MPGEPSTRRERASRERIVERAAGLFAERGIAATSVDEVLAARGRARASSTTTSAACLLRRAFG